MTPERRGLVPGDSPLDRGVFVAGALAELGVTRLAFVDDAGWLQLDPRNTDLPTLLAEAAEADGADAELLCLERPLRFEIREDAVEWVTTERGIADWLGTPPA